jgi:hypothetical protein
MTTRFPVADYALPDSITVGLLRLSMSNRVPPLDSQGFFASARSALHTVND